MGHPTVLLYSGKNKSGRCVAMIRTSFARAGPSTSLRMTAL
jgi:hypothetical protein